MSEQNNDCCRNCGALMFRLDCIYCNEETYLETEPDQPIEADPDYWDVDDYRG